MIGPALLFALGTPASAGFLKGPYLQQATPESIVVCWETDSESTGEVSFGLTAGMSMSATSASGTIHQVELTGLARSKVYHYEVTSDGETSTPATFATAPHEEEPFRFVMVGDTRTDTDAHQTPAPTAVGRCSRRRPEAGGGASAARQSTAPHKWTV